MICRQFLNKSHWPRLAFPMFQSIFAVAAIAQNNQRTRERHLSPPRVVLLHKHTPLSARCENFSCRVAIIQLWWLKYRGVVFYWLLPVVFLLITPVIPRWTWSDWHHKIIINIYCKFYTKAGFEPTKHIKLRYIPQPIWNPRCKAAATSASCTT